MSESRTKRPIWRLPMCWAALCGHRTNSDDTGVWGECNTCGSRVGFVSRADLRAYAARELAALSNPTNPREG